LREHNENLAKFGILEFDDARRATTEANIATLTEITTEEMNFAQLPREISDEMMHTAEERAQLLQEAERRRTTLLPSQSHLVDTIILRRRRDQQATLCICGRPRWNR
jgi:hypothetical protein